MSYLRIRKNTFETLTKKTTNFFFFFERRDRERNQRNRQKVFGKVRFDSYMFFKIEIRLVKSNRAGIEMYMKKGSTSRKESRKNRMDPRL